MNDWSSSSSPSLTLVSSAAPTLAAAIAAVSTWTDLTTQQQAAMAYKLTKVADLLGDPASLIILSPSFVRTRLLAPSPSAFGFGENTIRAYRNAVRQAMERLDVIDACDAPMSPGWRSLLDPLGSREKAPLARLADFCALRRIEPEQLTNEIFAEFTIWLTVRTLVASPKRLAGSCRRAWNRFARSIPNWPSTEITAAGDRHQYILPLDAFTPDFQADLVRLGHRLGARGRPFSANGDTKGAEGARARLRPERGPGLRPISVELRLGHVRWAASALVACGSVPLTAINAVTDLVQPLDRAHDIMEYLFELRGQKPWPGAMHALEVLMMLAKYEARLPEEQIEELRGWRQDVVPAAKGMSKSRRDRIRAMMEPHRLQLLLQLPETCMKQALVLLPTTPRDATSLALRALAVQLLLTTQLRLWNIISMKVGDHLQSDDPTRRRFQRLDIAAGDTKNTNEIVRPLSPATRAMLELWVRHFRPTLASDADGYLFPGHGIPHITRQGMRDAVKGIVKQVTGLLLTPHDFRGLAAKVHLHFHPGDYVTVMHLLGHKALPTTLESYTADEAERAAETFDRTVLGLTRGELRLDTPTSRKKKTERPRYPLHPRGGTPHRPRGRS